MSRWTVAIYCFVRSAVSFEFVAKTIIEFRELSFLLLLIAGKINRAFAMSNSAVIALFYFTCPTGFPREPTLKVEV